MHMQTWSRNLLEAQHGLYSQNNPEENHFEILETDTKHTTARMET